MPEVNAYALLLTAHVLLLVFWLGTDLGVFLGSFRLKDGRLEVAARLEIARLSALLDMGPRTGVILSIPTGLGLAYFGGHVRAELLTPPVLAVVSVGCLLWLAMVWRFFALQRAVARGHAVTAADARFLVVWRRIDLWWRIVLAVAIGIATALALLGRGLFSIAWLDWKVAAFGFVVVCGVGIRLAAEDLPVAVGEIARLGSTAERERRVARALRGAYPWVLAIYFTLVVMTYISFAKPA